MFTDEELMLIKIICTSLTINDIAKLHNYYYISNSIEGIANIVDKINTYIAEKEES